MRNYRSIHEYENGKIDLDEAVEPCRGGTRDFRNLKFGHGSATPKNLAGATPTSPARGCAGFNMLPDDKRTCWSNLDTKL
jgi:hypothetical protein